MVSPPPVPRPMDFDGYAAMREVCARHKDLRRRNPLLIPDSVETAGRIADRYVIESFCDEGDESGLGRGIITWGARLIYSIQYYGMDFESLCVLTDITIARSVAALTPDNRLGTMRRHQSARSSLVNSTYSEQVVRLAVLFAEAAHVSNITTGLDLKPAEKTLLAEWVTASRDLVAAFTHLKTIPYFDRQLKACDELLDRAGRPVGTARRPRRL